MNVGSRLNFCSSIGFRFILKADIKVCCLVNKDLFACGAYMILVEKSVVHRPLGRPRYRWYCNNKVDFKENGKDVTGLIYLIQVRDHRKNILQTVVTIEFHRKWRIFAVS
jgi:hypothetical protein